MLEEGLVAQLYSATGVTAIVGGQGIYPVLLPKDAALPALTFQRISDVTDAIFNAGVQFRTVRSRFQFSAWGKSYADTVRLARAVKAALLDFRGNLADADATTVLDVTADISLDLFEDGPRYFRKTFDLIMWYADAQPGQIGWMGGGGGVTVTIVPFTASAAGNFTVAHGLGVVPKGCAVAMKSAGAVWFQSPTRFDATNVYLVSSDAALAGELEVYV